LSAKLEESKNANFDPFLFQGSIHSEEEDFKIHAEDNNPFIYKGALPSFEASIKESNPFLYKGAIPSFEDRLISHEQLLYS
jgi:hypothetical protein